MGTGLIRVVLLGLGWLVLAVAAGCQAARPPGAIGAQRAATNPAEQSRLGRAKDLFYQSVAGDRAALPQAQQVLEELGGGNSPDPQVVAYTGATTLLEASRSQNFFEKTALGHKGMELEDRAVDMAPGDLEVRFLQGVTYYQLPGFLGRHQTAIDDLTTVARVAEAAARSGRLDPRAAAADLVYYGKAREEKYDAAGAIAAWRAALRIDPGSKAGEDARKHLAEHNATS